jgi:hypothetical protein
VVTVFNMGQVDLNFKPSVPVFDANVALGRRHDRRVRVDTVEGTLGAMGRAGVGRALVYAPHAVAFDGREGNQLLLDTIRGEPSLVPQYVCSPATDDLDSFAAIVMEHGVRSIRMAPRLHAYPFRDWVVNPWLEWLAAEKLPLWMPVDQVDPAELYDVARDHPEVKIVLSEVHYSHVTWAMPLLRSLPNVCVEISRFVVARGVSRLVEAIGAERILYGSRFPDGPMAPQLYNLHRSGLSEASLAAICSGNLERLLGIK